ncbi:MAG: sulfite exporter TauE/SafE family protein [Ectothiorhodospiraceae bacterium]|nr:sulfite exporter TauE/SafE family protein [Ectothiorhodospiraceae bacterium]MCH8503206.1 sulfite exporter TauE/SafE family protein [Ectothiorhodospiraceae bacterium]
MGELAYLVPLLLLCGAVAGILAGLLGVGGGIVIVPMLFHVFLALQIDAGVAMQVSVGTSLATIIFTSFMSARAHHARGTIDTDLVKRWVPWVILGTVGGILLSRVISGESMKLGFGVLLVFVASHMLLSSRVETGLFAGLPGQALQRFYGALVGVFSTLLGIGGGTLMVPLLSLYSYPIHRAVATASVFGLVISAPATLGYIWSGHGTTGTPPLSSGFVNWVAFAVLVPATMLFAPLGVKIAYRLNVSMLKQAFAVFLGLVGLRMLIF